MQFKSLRLFLLMTFTTLLVCLSLAAHAQPAGLLYDPEPPVDSAYVRVIFASRDGPVDIMIDGRPRIRNLGVGEFSDYLVLNAGKHTMSIHPAGKSVAHLSTPIEVIRGRAMTIAFATLKTGATPIVFEDKANTNKLKVQLAVYHLSDQAGPLDILTSDGNTKVFSGVIFGASTSLQVNPISIELIAAKGGDKIAQARTSLSMAQGGTYSILLSSGEGGKLLARTTQNKIERYTGK
jgi:alginate O-acetyltransferase complex protein AlgF